MMSLDYSEILSEISFWIIYTIEAVSVMILVLAVSHLSKTDKW